jgi:hypothetical protein
MSGIPLTKVIPSRGYFSLAHSYHLGWLALGIVLIIYILISTFSQKNVFWSPDEGARFMVANIITSDPEDRISIGYPGYYKDPAFRFHPGYYKYEGFMYPTPVIGGRVISPWNIIFPFISGLAFRFFGINGVYYIPLVCSWLIALVIWKIAIKVNVPYPYLAVILVGLGTPIFFYGQVYWEHTLATLLGLLALVSLISNPRISYKSIFFVFFPLILTIILRVEMFAFVIALILAWFISRKRSTNEKLPDFQIKSYKIFLSIFIFSSISILLLIYFLPSRYSSEFNRLIADINGGSNALETSLRFVKRNLSEIPHVLINYSAGEGLQLPDELSWMGVAAIIVPIVGFFRYPKDSKLIFYPISLLMMIGITLIALFSEREYRSLHGFFLCCPYSIVVTFGFLKAWQRKNYHELLIFLTTILYLLIGAASILILRASKEASSWPGLEWGQRYLLTLYPLMVIASFLSLKEIWLLKSKEQISNWSLYLNHQAPNPLITNEWWLPGSLAYDFMTHEMYLAHSDEDFSQLISMMRSTNVNGFTFISSFPDDLLENEYLSFGYRLEKVQDVNGLNFAHFIGTSSPP